MHLYVKIDGYQRLYLHTGVNVDARHWNPYTCTVKKSHPDHYNLNLMITNLERKLEDYRSWCMQKGKPFSKQTLTSHLQGKDQGMKLVDFCRSMLYQDKVSLAPETIRLRESVINNLEKFTSARLVDIDFQWLTHYHRHLLTTMKPSTTGKNHKIIKRALVRAQRVGLIEKNPYDDFRIPDAPRRINYLTAQELQKVRNYKGIPRLEKVRDLFLFQCLTGLAYADMQQLNMTDIQHTQGQRYIVNNRKKTSTLQLIPLMPEAWDIIQQYAEDDKCFPRISNQKMNAYLHEIQDITGINKPLTTHLGRHTFATLMLAKGLPLESVSHILGHTSTRVTQIYARVVFEKLQEDFLRLNINSL